MIVAKPQWRLLFERAQRQRWANIICMKWGTRYSAEYVNRLYGMVVRNTTWKFRFVCFTDDSRGIRPEVECRSLPEAPHATVNGSYWPKLGMMRDDIGLEGMTLFLDLDLLVIDNIDPFFEIEGRFFMVREWKDRELGYGNSSVVRFFGGLESAVLDRFAATSRAEIEAVYANKEQNFLTRAVDEVLFWPDEWCPSFAHACLPRNRLLRFFSTPNKPRSGRIMVFYGSITPASAQVGQHEPTKRVRQGFAFRPWRRRFGPADWIAEYWRV